MYPEGDEGLPSRETLPRCSYAVADSDGQYDACGLPAVALWRFPDGGCMNVCEKHDLEIIKLEGPCN